MTHGVNIVCQNLGSPLYKKQAISNPAGCLGKVFLYAYIYVLIFCLNFNMNNF